MTKDPDSTSNQASLKSIFLTFLSIGARSYGGWSTTALLVEQEYVEKRKLLSSRQLKTSVGYAQILPGATQVSIVASAGHFLGKIPGAITATVGYLSPAIILLMIFSVVYFHFSHNFGVFGRTNLWGLQAVLSGIILANAYKIGQKNIGKRQYLWIGVFLAFLGVYWLRINAVIILLFFAAVGIAIVQWRRR